MKQYVTAYIFSTCIFVSLDLVWLLVVAHDFYSSRMGDLVEYNVPAIIIFYLIYILGVTFFVTRSALQSSKNTWKTVLFFGSLFGFFCFCTYELSALSVIKDWSVSLVIVDVLWATMLTGVSATVSYIFTHRLFSKNN